MKRVFSLFALCVTVFTYAQTSYLPVSAKNIQHTPVYNDPMFRLIDQKGRIPYKGHTCSYASTSSEQGTDGKMYGENEYATVELKIQYYTPEGKMVLDQIIASNAPELEVQSHVKSQKAGADNPNYKRSVITKVVSGGKMVITTDHYTNCAEDVYKEYHSINYSSYAIVGTAHLRITGNYNSKDAALAEKWHNKIVEQVKKIGFK
jgi:hypothetical protein